jgi:hypothetical protein
MIWDAMALIIMTLGPMTLMKPKCWWTVDDMRCCDIQYNDTENNNINQV